MQLQKEVRGNSWLEYRERVCFTDISAAMRIFKRDFVISKCYVFDDFLTSMEFSYVQDAQKECGEK